MNRTPNTCRAYDCRDGIPAAHIMCKRHWSLVKQSTRMRLFKLWRQSPESQACHEAINDARKEVQDYLDARAAGWRVPHAV